MRCFVEWSDYHEVLVHFKFHSLRQFSQTSAKRWGITHFKTVFDCSVYLYRQLENLADVSKYGTDCPLQLFDSIQLIEFTCPSSESVAIPDSSRLLKTLHIVLTSSMNANSSALNIWQIFS